MFEVEENYFLTGLFNYNLCFVFLLFLFRRDFWVTEVFGLEINSLQ
jgi:hypothetical protein